MEEPWASWTNLAYVVAGVAVVAGARTPEAVVLALALFALAAGSFWMHSTLDYGAPETADHAGIHLVFATLAVLAWGGPWWIAAAVALVAAWGLEVRANVPIEYGVAGYVAVVSCGAWVAGAWVPLVVGAVFLATGYLLHRTRATLGHGIWHLLTAAGIYMWYFVYG